MRNTHFTENLCHLKGSCCVHVGCNDGDTGVGLLGVAECEGPLKINLKLNKILFSIQKITKHLQTLSKH